MDRRSTFIVFQDPPFAFMVDKSDSNDISLDGYGIDIWKSLHEVLNFSYSVTPSNDGTFNGMINMVVQNEADFVLSLMALTKPRADLVQHTISVESDKYEPKYIYEKLM